MSNEASLTSVESSEQPERMGGSEGARFLDVSRDGHRVFSVLLPLGFEDEVTA